MVTRRPGPRVLVHPTENRLIVVAQGVRMELDFASAGRLVDEMNGLLRMFDPSRGSR